MQLTNEPCNFFFVDMIHEELKDYVDDINVKSKILLEHKATPPHVLHRSREFNLKLNPQVCLWCVFQSIP